MGKISAFKKYTNKKMEQINKNIAKELQQNYSGRILDSQKKIDDLNKIILEDNNKIKNIKNKLPNVDGNCGIYENCRSCTASETCGWCSLTNACVPGTKDGPSKGQCSFFEFGSCSGPRSCDSYDKCGDCIKDVACGWCNKSGKQSRIDKKLNDSGECKEDFIHIWKNTNTCPHNKNMN